MEFVLDQSFDEIFAVNQTSKPLEVLKLLQFFPETLSKFSMQFNETNAVNIELQFADAIKVSKHLFEGLPCKIFLSERIHVFDGKHCSTIELEKQINKGGSERVVIGNSAIEQFNSIIFENIFGSLLPAAMASKRQIKSFICAKKLTELTNVPDKPSIFFEHFNDAWQINKKTFFLDNADFEYSDETLGYGFQLALTNNPRDFIVTDASTEHAGELKEFLKQSCPDLLRANVGLDFRFWDKNEKYASVQRKILSLRKQQLVHSAKHTILNFLGSEKVINKATEIKKIQDTVAVEKLDSRKNNIRLQSYVLLENGMRFKVPCNEYETVILFSGLLGAKQSPFYQFEILDYSSSEGIDAICSYKIEKDDVLKKDVAVEFEFKLSNFFKHRHPPQHVELIICWKIDVMQSELTETGYPWLFKMDYKNKSLYIVEIEALNLKRSRDDTWKN